ncbi:hypothetical protein [Hymenobacter swuensis]|uniref:hypothetical protein n=1 Tax=Hymenobacter swuensis TaxID=1446467 RepID=UPI0012DD1B98|nr:hypothetical protein [Hymenobacter swuensis]
MQRTSTIMKGNALQTGNCGFPGAYPTFHLVATGENLAGTPWNLNCAHALETLLLNFPAQRLNWLAPATQPWLVSLGHQRGGDHSTDQLPRHTQLLRHPEAVWAPTRCLASAPRRPRR